MKKLVTLGIVSSMAILASFQAFATDTGSGCGVGAQIFTKNSVISQTLAGATNQISSQNSSITSSTSGCKANGFVKLDRQEIYYAETNYDVLSVEMAKGKGENLSAFAELLGCNDQGIEALGQMTKAKYQTLFPAKSLTPATLLKSVKQNISQDRYLSQVCGKVST